MTAVGRPSVRARIARRLRQTPRRFLVAYGLAAVLALASVGVFLAGRFGGAHPSADRPYVWDGRSSLTVAYQHGSRSTGGCAIAPADAAAGRRTYLLEGRWRGRPGRGFDELRLVTDEVTPWFSGTATVTCRNAGLFRGPTGVVVSLWHTGWLLAAVVAIPTAVAETAHHRRRRAERTA